MLLFQCDDTRGCVMEFWLPDDEHMCSKHVEAWNKLIVKQNFCASNWLITEINEFLSTVSWIRTLLFVRTGNANPSGCGVHDRWSVYEKRVLRTVLKPKLLDVKQEGRNYMKNFIICTLHKLLWWNQAGGDRLISELQTNIGTLCGMILKFTTVIRMKRNNLSSN